MTQRAIHNAYAEGAHVGPWLHGDTSQDRRGGWEVKLYRCVVVLLQVRLVDMMDIQGMSEFQGRPLEI